MRLAAFSRVQTREKPFEHADLNGVLGHARANLSSSIDESGAVVIHDGFSVLMADEGQMTLVFRNLVGNAIRFGGEEPSRIHIGVIENATEWEISVGDNGIGINPAFHDRIFVILQRLHGRDEHKGTGIGRALCKRIVERHGGRM